MLSIFLIVLFQFNLSNGSIFLPPPKEWKLTNLDELTRPTNSQVLNLNEQWRTWLLTQSTVTDLQFQQSLNLKLTHVERSTHALARQILTQFPTMILTGGYVRDIVINNEKGFTNQLDFYVPTNGIDGQPKTAIDDVAASIKQFGTKNNLVVASPVCVATTTKGRCTKLNVEVCAVVDGTTFDNLDKCGDDATEKITIRLVVGAFESVEFAANGLTLQCDVGVSTVDVDVLDVAKAVNDVRMKILDLVIGHLERRSLRTGELNEKMKRGVERFLEGGAWKLTKAARRDLINCGEGQWHESGFNRRQLGGCQSCAAGTWQDQTSHTTFFCKNCGALTACEAGNFLDCDITSGDIIPRKCPIGKYQNEANPTRPIARTKESRGKPLVI